MIACNEAMEKLFDYLIKELDQIDWEQVNKHLEVCKKCCTKYDFEKKLFELVKTKTTKEKASVYLKEKILSLINKF